MSKAKNTMRDATTTPAQPQTDGCSAYIVTDGVELICGRKVAGGDQIQLTPAEALYDLALGRLALAQVGATDNGGA